MQRLGELLSNIWQARSYKSLPRQGIELLAHKLKINTDFIDYYRFGFYKSDESWEEKSLYLGPNGSRYWPFEGNSLKFDPLFAVKSIQKSLLIGAGLPTPRMLLKAGSEYPVNSLEKFRDALATVRAPVVTKFDGGGGGTDVHVLERSDDGFSHDGEAVDAEWIWQKYAARIDRGFLLEERIDNHPALAAIHPASLNTLRLAVVKTADRRWHFLKPFLKIGRGGSKVDNMSAHGLFTGLDDNGIAGTAYCRYDDGEYECHPNTGARIRGFQVPFFDEALALAVHASKTLGFMSTFGWDIAITADGPMIVEANPGWNFRSVQQRLGPLLTAKIAAGLMPRAWYTPWDRTRMYPHYLGHYRGGWWQRRLAARRERWQERLRSRAGIQ